MSQPALPPRLSRQEADEMREPVAWILAWVLGIGLAANGLMMLVGPARWYAAVPGVQLLVDLPTVFLPPALAVWIAWTPSGRSAGAKGATR
jgi:hypothetical protein